MVDEGRILRLLRSISDDDVSVLSREGGADETRREDPIWLRGVYTFVTAIEACADVGPLDGRVIMA